MKDNIFAHPGLRIASLVIAFAIWLVTMNVSNPEITHTYTGVSVNVTNSAYVESKQQLYVMMDRVPTVNVTVHTNRRTIERLSTTSITATADLTQIEDFTSPVYVPVTVNVPGVNMDDVTVSPKMIEISLEDMESREFVINPTTAGTTPSNGYEVGRLTASPDKLKIRGPKTLVDKIDKVNAEISVTGISKDQSIGAKIVVYDKNGEALTDSQMENLTISDSTDVRVSVILYTVLSDVPIHAETYGQPADGFQVSGITTTPETLKVVGDADSLEVFQANGGVIEIPESSQDVDISGASGDQDINVDITHYLPDGISLASDTSATVIVSVKILPFNSKSVEIETKGIEKQHLPGTYTAVFADTKLEIRVTGTDEDLAALSPEDITASVDLTEVEPGDITVPVDVVLPEGLSLVDPVTAEMTVSEVTNTAATESSVTS